MKMVMQDAQDENAGRIHTEHKTTPTAPAAKSDQRGKREWSRREMALLAARALAEEHGAPKSLESILNRAIADLDAAIDLHPVVESAIRIRIAESYLKLRRLEDAAVQCQSALDLFDRTFSIKHPYSIRTRQNLAVVRLHQGQITEAALLYQQLHEIRLVENGPDDLKTLATLRFASMLRRFEANPVDGALLSEPPPPIQRLLDLELPSCRFQPIEF